MTKTSSKTEVKKDVLQLVHMFPTMLGTYMCTDEKLLDQLRLEIYKKKGRNPEGIYRSNSAGCWHSDDGLLNWAGEAGKQLSKVFGSKFRAYTSVFGAKDDDAIDIAMHAWAMVYSDGGYSTVHTHPNCHMSGVLYLDNPEGDVKTMATGVRVSPGDIEMIDTRSVNNTQMKPLNMNPAFRLSPVRGQMIIFPSWLPHFVHPITSQDDRICIACNATIQKVERKSDDSDK